jgi:hypothetical protein
LEVCGICAGELSTVHMSSIEVYTAEGAANMCGTDVRFIVAKPVIAKVL